jgi:hypothetical protein
MPVHLSEMPTTHRYLAPARYDDFEAISETADHITLPSLLLCLGLFENGPRIHI